MPCCDMQDFAQSTSSFIKIGCLLIGLVEKLAVNHINENRLQLRRIFRVDEGRLKARLAGVAIGFLLSIKTGCYTTFFGDLFPRNSPKTNFIFYFLGILVKSFALYIMVFLVLYSLCSLSKRAAIGTHSTFSEGIRQWHVPSHKNVQPINTLPLGYHREGRFNWLLSSNISNLSLESLPESLILNMPLKRELYSIISRGAEM